MMNKNKILQPIISEHGDLKKLVHDTKRVESLIKDCIKDKLSCNLLCLILRSGIASKMATMDVTDKLQVEQWIETLVESHGISRENAEKYTLIWINELDINYNTGLDFSITANAEPEDEEISLDGELILKTKSGEKISFVKPDSNCSDFIYFKYKKAIIESCHIWNKSTCNIDSMDAFKSCDFKNLIIKSINTPLEIAFDILKKNGIYKHTKSDLWNDNFQETKGVIENLKNIQKNYDFELDKYLQDVSESERLNNYSDNAAISIFRSWNAKRDARNNTDSSMTVLVKLLCEEKAGTAIFIDLAEIFDNVIVGSSNCPGQDFDDLIGSEIASNTIMENIRGLEKTNPKQYITQLCNANREFPLNSEVNNAIFLCLTNESKEMLSDFLAPALALHNIEIPISITEFNLKKALNSKNCSPEVLDLICNFDDDKINIIKDVEVNCLKPDLFNDAFNSQPSPKLRLDILRAHKKYNQNIDNVKPDGLINFLSVSVDWQLFSLVSTIINQEYGNCVVSNLFLYELKKELPIEGFVEILKEKLRLTSSQSGLIKEKLQNTCDYLENKALLGDFIYRSADPILKINLKDISQLSIKNLESKDLSIKSSLYAYEFNEFTSDIIHCIQLMESLKSGCIDNGYLIVSMMRNELKDSSLVVSLLIMELRKLSKKSQDEINNLIISFIDRIETEEKFIELSGHLKGLSIYTDIKEVFLSREKVKGFDFKELINKSAEISTLIDNLKTLATQIHSVALEALIINESEILNYHILKLCRNDHDYVLIMKCFHEIGLDSSPALEKFRNKYDEIFYEKFLNEINKFKKIKPYLGKKDEPIGFFGFIFTCGVMYAIFCGALKLNHFCQGTFHFQYDFTVFKILNYGIYGFASFTAIVLIFGYLGDLSSRGARKKLKLELDEIRKNNPIIFDMDKYVSIEDMEKSYTEFRKENFPFTEDLTRNLKRI